MRKAKLLEILKEIPLNKWTRSFNGDLFCETLTHALLVTKINDGFFVSVITNGTCKLVDVTKPTFPKLFKVSNEVFEAVQKLWKSA